jgi:hypothetical protein
VPVFSQALEQTPSSQKEEVIMKTQLFFLSVMAGFFLAATPNASAQVGVEIGPAPVCPYGYYEVPPYNCAPDGYYGPDWFSGGVFIGAGPWYHGPDHFYGHVDHRFDFRHGYHGGFPARGERPSDHRSEFHGNAMHDSHGREAPRGRR